MSKLSHITLLPLNTKTVEYAKGYSKFSSGNAKKPSNNLIKVTGKVELTIKQKKLLNLAMPI